MNKFICFWVKLIQPSISTYPKNSLLIYQDSIYIFIAKTRGMKVSKDSGFWI